MPLNNCFTPKKILLEVWSNTHHLQQAYCGFYMLEKLGFINLSQHITNPPSGYIKEFCNIPHLKRHYLTCFIAKFNDVNVVFDMSDSFEVSQSLYENSDFYIKRSYLKSYLVEQDFYNKTIPYGPFYEVYANQFDPFLLKRSLKLSYDLKHRLRSVIRSLNCFDRISFAPRECNITPTTKVKNSTNPKIIFSVNLHDPYDDAGRSREKIEERIFLIEERANLVRSLKKEFPNNYIGGIKDNATARKFAPDCILPDPTLFSKANYFKLLKSCSIGISTTGLHNSVGGKFGEYLATGKSIVTSPLLYQQGAGLNEGKNYLVAKNNDGFIVCCHKLLDDPSLMNDMYEYNLNYYQEYLSPDKKILNLLNHIDFQL